VAPCTSFSTRYDLIAASTDICWRQRVSSLLLLSDLLALQHELLHAVALVNYHWHCDLFAVLLTGDLATSEYTFNGCDR
jgi:hypothetical protein